MCKRERGKIESKEMRKKEISPVVTFAYCCDLESGGKMSYSSVHIVMRFVGDDAIM